MTVPQNSRQSNFVQQQSSPTTNSQFSPLSMIGYHNSQQTHQESINTLHNKRRSSYLRQNATPSAFMQPVNMLNEQQLPQNRMAMNAQAMQVPHWSTLQKTQAHLQQNHSPTSSNLNNHPWHMQNPQFFPYEANSSAYHNWSLYNSKKYVKENHLRIESNRL